MIKNAIKSCFVDILVKKNAIQFVPHVRKNATLLVNIANVEVSAVFRAECASKLKIFDLH